MFGYPPFTRDQRLGTLLTVLGILLVFGTNRYLVYGQPRTWLLVGSGLALCAVGVYFNTRRRHKP